MRVFLRYKTMIAIMALTFVSSCTIQKRVHRKGWFVQWNLNKKAPTQGKIEEISRTEFITKDSVFYVSQNKSIKNLETRSSHSRSAQKPDEKLPSPSTVETIDGEATLKEHTRPFKQIVHHSKKEPLRKEQSHQASPTRVPTLAWALLIAGLAFLGLGIALAIIFLILNGSLIGAPFYILATIIAGILFLILATRTALSTFDSQPSAPDPRYEKQEPKKEKKERQPLKKGDKIFLAVVAGLALIIGIVLLSY